MQYCFNARLLLYRQNASYYTGWPKKNATLSITNFKEFRDLIKVVSAVMSRTFFSQQNDTKINDFDERVLILDPFFWVSVIFKFAPFVSKVTFEVGRNFSE